MKWWKFLLLVALLATPIVFGLSLIPGVGTMLLKAWTVIWFILRILIGILFTALVIFGPFGLGYVINSGLMPELDGWFDDSIRFGGIHYLVLSILWAISIALLTELLIVYGTYVPPVDFMMGFVHPGKFSSPGVWEVWPSFWPFYGLIIGIWGLVVGYNENN